MSKKMQVYLALIGAILSTVSNIPQVYKVRKMNTTSDLHSYTIILHFFSAIVWSVYGFILELYILGIESGFVAFLNLLIICAIVRDRYISPEKT